MLTKIFVILGGIFATGLIFFCLYISGIFGPSGHNLNFYIPNSFISATTASFPVLMRDASGKPVTDALVKVRLESIDGKVVYEKPFVANRDGVAIVDMKIPEKPGDYRFRLEVKSSAGKDIYNQLIKVVPATIKLFLISDKSAYQPADIIHIQLLAVDSFYMKPVANLPAKVEIKDTAGITIFSQRISTSESGIATYDFQLAEDTKPGSYTISATTDNGHSTNREVKIDMPMLAKFESKIKLPRGFFWITETIKAKVSSIANAPVKLMVEGLDFKKEFEGKTDENGEWQFELPLPSLPLQGSESILKLTATVTDSTGHTETTSADVIVSEKKVKVEIIPEGGEFATNLDNYIYMIVRYPDSTPCGPRNIYLSYKHNNKAYATGATTDKSGVAVIKFPAGVTSFHMKVNLKHLGITETMEIDLSKYPKHTKELVLLIDKATYTAGEPVMIDVFTETPEGYVYLDVIKNEQTILTRTMKIENHKGAILLNIPPEVYGLVEISAYKIAKDATIYQDTRWIFIKKGNWQWVDAGIEEVLARDDLSQDFKKAMLCKTLQPPQRRQLPLMKGIKSKSR